MAVGPSNNGDRKAKDKDNALEVPSFGSPASVMGTKGCIVICGETWSTQQVACTTEWVPAWIATSCLDLVEPKYLGSVMAVVGLLTTVTISLTHTVMSVLRGEDHNTDSPVGSFER